jgi:hypothetical protein
MKKINSVYAFFPLFSLIATSCGGSSTSSTSSSTSPSAAVANVSVATLPNVSSMITSNSENSSNLSRSAIVRAVSGTAPLLTAISSDNVDQYFWDGLIAILLALPDGSYANQAQRVQFMGNTVGLGGGMGACQMAQGVGESFSNLISSSGTACYMKGIASVSSGVTVDSGSQADIFKATESDKIVKITLAGMPNGGGGGGGGGDGGGDMPSSVFFKIYSSNSNTYKADLWMCSAQGGVTQIESIIVDKTSGSYTNTSTQSRDGQNGTYSITASLKAKEGDSSSLVFDSSKDRTFNGRFSNTYQNNINVYKGNLTINSSNEIISKIYRKNTGSWGTNIDKLSSASSFSGSSLKDLRFLAAGFNGKTAQGNYTNNYDGGIEFQDTKYVTVAGSTLEETANLVNLDSDAFYTTDLEAPTLENPPSCSETPTINVTMNFADSAVQGIRETCDGDRFDNYQMCYGENVQNAQRKTWGQ